MFLLHVDSSLGIHFHLLRYVGSGVFLEAWFCFSGGFFFLNPTNLGLLGFIFFGGGGFWKANPRKVNLYLLSFARWIPRGLLTTPDLTPSSCGFAHAVELQARRTRCGRKAPFLLGKVHKSPIVAGLGASVDKYVAGVRPFAAIVAVSRRGNLSNARPPQLKTPRSSEGVQYISLFKSRR